MTSLLIAKCVHLAIAAQALYSVPALESEAEAIVGDSETIARTRRRRCSRGPSGGSGTNAIVRRGALSAQARKRRGFAPDVRAEREQGSTTHRPPSASNHRLLDYAWSGDVDVVAALLNHG